MCEYCVFNFLKLFYYKLMVLKRGLEIIKSCESVKKIVLYGLIIK